MEKLKLKIIHLQLTSRCNLRCSYCGQWGKHGFMKQAKNADIPVEVWKKTINSIHQNCPSGEALPHICVWGGEPLLYSGFDKVAEYIFSSGFNLGMVTNGTLLNRHADSVSRYISTLYISIEGPAEIHEKCRGINGIFNNITENIRILKNSDFSGTLVCLCTINQYNYKIIPEIPFLLDELGFDKVIFQPLMFFSQTDIMRYKQWMKNTFNITASHADSWSNEEIMQPGSYIYNLQPVIQTLFNNIKSEKYQIECVCQPSILFPDNILLWYSGDTESLLPDNQSHCMAPWYHLHITSSGNVNFCVDFDDFTAGNIFEEDITEIIVNKLSRKFKQEILNGKNPFCKRCPWRFNTTYRLDEKRKNDGDI